MAHQFKLTREQSERIEEWTHSHECHIVEEGAIGGKITYQFTPNAIGTTEKAVCACGAELDVTDYDSW